MKYLTFDQILEIHSRQIERFGGTPGLRDIGLVSSAVAQPRVAFGGNSVYPTLEEMGAALAYSIVKNHGFVDGNKRTGIAALEMFLRRIGYAILAPLEEKESITLR